MEQNNIELRSEKVRNIIGNIPSLFVRFGIISMIFIFIGLFLIAWYFPYSENIRLRTSLNKEKEEHIQAAIYIPYTYISRIQIGMSTSIELDGYNAKTYGFIYGNIDKIDKKVVTINGENFFLVSAVLDLKDIKIDLRDGMKGTAIILLSNESILKHIFDLSEVK